MEKDFYQEMKQSLHEHRAQIIKTFVANNESFKQIIESVDPKDFGDIASEDTDRKMLECMGENRTYENAVCIRVVDASDGMTASFSRLPYDLLENVSRRIINEVDGINRVVYDISSKPPATIEWE